ncbi:TetR/AcrR family transcriptional regulator [Streptomyces sp. VRA16 Mangrove soil]|uniref:TetR/AcrR family transcriptional regulator n=1 Tax=Streptomyces sp. VRA16 Mangrove soil TaxID=2817434 RepID=UPI001A9EB286|nr:TetR/AcrR family transcriptional regulator [Streptomyces sp. VRA16 Mangrove soil]MBO1330808.1 TetR/AcrR family transcriptional regulator [Streptomyces sp. VRA16 Mangrove soil]
MGEATQSRRARLRVETTSEIKSIALKHMATGGPAAVSLRGIAREMGMTAGAIYSYFANRDDLITALTVDVYESLAQTLEASHQGAPTGSPAAQMLAHARAYRTWAVAHPEEFRLLYGDPVPGYQPPAAGAAQEAEHRLCAVLLDLVASAWPEASAAEKGSDYDWSDFQPSLTALTRESFPDLPPAAVALCLRLWSRMHGLLTLEIYGHLRHQVTDPGKLYEADMHDLIHTLGLTPPR